MENQTNHARNRLLVSAVLVAALLVPLLLFGFGMSQSGTLVVAHHEGFATLDVTTSTRRSTLGIARVLMFDPLILRDSDGSFQPGLATAWRQIDDLTLELDLRQGVTFHDGTPFDAESVRFTIEKLLDPDQRTAQGFLWEGIIEVQIINDFQVRIVTARPFGPLMAHLTLGAMLPPNFDSEVNTSQPVGTGPFQFVSWSPGEELVVEANPDFWGDAPGVERVVFRPIIEDATRIAGVMSGDIHIAFGVPVQLVSVLDATADVSIARIQSPITQHISLGGDARPPVGGDPRVLQAIDLAIDRETLVRDIFQGQAEMPTSIYSPNVFAAHPNLPAKVYDPERAIELLAEAGYPDGFEADMWYTAGAELQIADAVVAISQQLAAVGIIVNIRVAADWGVGGPIINGRNFDMYYNGWATYTLDPDFYVWPNFHPNARNREGTDTYEFGAEVVSLVEQGRFNTDPQVRTDAYHRLQEILWENPTRLPVVQPFDLYAVRSEVQGFSPRSSQMWWDLRQVTLGN
jgi:peptide/nickel transport system substrate-binding protein